MATLLDVGDVLKVTIVCRAQNQNALNVRHYSVLSNVGTGATMEQFAASLSTDLAPLYKQLISADAEYQGVIVQIVFPVASQPILDETGNGPGEVAGDLNSLQVAGLINLKTGTPGRQGRGRSYIGVSSELSNSSLARPVNQYVTDLQALADEMTNGQNVINGANESLCVPVIVNRPGFVTSLVIGARARKVWATQRRRTQLRGGDIDLFA